MCKYVIRYVNITVCLTFHIGISEHNYVRIRNFKTLLWNKTIYCSICTKKLLHISAPYPSYESTFTYDEIKGIHHVKGMYIILVFFIVSATIPF